MSETIEEKQDLYLGKNIAYKQTYAPELLRKIDRVAKRKANGIGDILYPGIDIWNHYEISFLSKTGVPQAIIGILSYSSDSKYMVESKSLKMYFNSFNQEQTTLSELQTKVVNDLSALLETQVKLVFRDLNIVWPTGPAVAKNTGVINLDYMTEIKGVGYDLDLSPLDQDEPEGPVVFVTNAFKSNCQVTNQPDFATCSIFMDGKTAPSPESLFKFLISFRSHNEFHEDAADRIYHKLLKEFAPDKMYVLLQYSRRGGIDINPLRVWNIVPEAVRLNRISRQ